MIRGPKVRDADRLLGWLRQIAEDRELTPFAVRVAVIIAHQCHGQKGYAEISQQRLADEIGATKTGVRNALAALVERHHINIVQLGANKMPMRYQPRYHSAEMPIGCATVIAPKRAPKGATPIAHSSADYATAIAPVSGKRSAVQEAALRDSEMRARHRRFAR